MVAEIGKVESVNGVIKKTYMLKILRAISHYGKLKTADIRLKH
jgi:hypothetical protein